MYNSKTKPITPRSAASGWQAWWSVAMPSEHGGWGFLLEPLLLGVLVAPTAAAFLLALATVTGFLIRQPLKLWLVDRRRKLHTARTERAQRLSIALAAVAAMCFAAALWLAGPDFLTPLLLAVPFGVVFLYYDLTKPGRTLQAELAAPPAMAVVAPAMAVMDGWALAPALVMWVALTARSVPSIIYVRARVRLDRGREPDLAGPIALHVAGLAVIALFVWRGLLAPVVLLPYLLLLVRAVWFLSPSRPRMALKFIGFMELGLGIFMVIVLAISFWTAG